MKKRIQVWIGIVLIGVSSVPLAVAEQKAWDEGILVLVDSRVFDGFLFDHDANVLKVYFCTGDIMEYRDVPCASYQALMNAEDRVTWFSTKIYRAFPCRRIASAFRPSHNPPHTNNNQEVSNAIRQSSHSRR